MPHADDRQRPMIAALRWANLVSTVGLMIGAPPLLGWWLDGVWGTGPWLLVVGIVLGICGFIVGMRDLIRMTQRSSGRGQGGARRES